MDNFAHDMACLVRNLFPEEEHVNHNHTYRKNNVGIYDNDINNNNKRKRNSIFAALSPSPIREIRTVPSTTSTQLTTGTASTTGELPGVHAGHECSMIKKNLFQDEPTPQSYAYIPSEDFFERFAEVLEKCYPPNTDYIIIRDAVLDDDAEFMGTNAEEVPLHSLTKSQVDSIRVMAISPQRMKTMKEMGKLILGSKFGRDPLSFNYGASFWYSVLRNYQTFRQIYTGEKANARRFDLLFGFTYYLFKHPHWLTHHGRGWGGEKMIEGLATRWRNLLKYRPTQLQLDEEFSLPALIYFLDEFKTMVEAAEMYGDPKMRFDYI